MHPLSVVFVTCRIRIRFLMLFCSCVSVLMVLNLVQYPQLPASDNSYSRYTTSSYTGTTTSSLNAAKALPLYLPPPFIIEKAANQSDREFWLERAQPVASSLLFTPSSSPLECASLRYRRSTDLNARQDGKGSPIVRLGLEFLEDVDGFTSVNYLGSFHFYHFVEMAVAAFVEVHRFQASLDNSSIAVTTPWIYIPHMSMTQICGGGTLPTATTLESASNLNCLLAHLVFGGQNGKTATAIRSSALIIHGLESNNHNTSRLHPRLRPSNETVAVSSRRFRLRRRDDSSVPSASVIGDRSSKSSITSRHDAMMQEADVVLSIFRPKCVEGPIRKMWWRHMDHFPAQAWHANLARQLQIAPTMMTSDPGSSSSSNNTTKNIIRIGYMDRQGTGRNLPRVFHRSILLYLQRLQKHSPYSDVTIEFHHLHNMEKLQPLQQARIAASLDILVGAHGNGLSHMFFMKPGGAVLEIFWEFTNFKYDYATAAQMMHHDYVCLYNGRPIDPDRIAARDASLLQEFSWSRHAQGATPLKERIQSGVKASMHFIDDAIARMRGRLSE